MDRISRVGVFAAVVEEQSFAGAARRLGLTSSAVSKQVQNLELDLKVKLLNRTTRNVSVTGMLVGDFVDDHFDAFLERMSEWYRAGQVTYREDIRDGLENAPACYADMMAGRNLGKTLVRVSPEDG